ncbi:thioredoxin-like protein [Cristinia sonorae]|uniref:Large ribosomal subunit protein mL43 n=1 Tax=Cristinia sonorae TaxID=1940300 RepID=A0A8K0UFW9_9AGAR|nr:thioredoxin-like protein [Cristinia sonorae]
MASATKAATRPLLRASLSSSPANGHVAFIPQVRKVVIEYCDSWASSANTRTFVHNHLENVARANPHVEFVVKQRTHKEPIARGFYLNNRDKVVPLHGFEVNGIANKIQLILDSSGAKIKPLKRRTVESTTESARGIWSGLHVDEPFKI